MNSSAADYHGRCSHKRYRLTCAQFDELYEAALGRCQICGKPGPETTEQMLFVDHDYMLGQYAVRGLLCNRCNSCLGWAPGLLPEGAVERYLNAPWHVGRLAPPPPRVSPSPEIMERLRALGERREQITAELAELRPLLAAAIRADAAAGVSQAEIAEACGYSREMVRQILLPARSA